MLMLAGCSFAFTIPNGECQNLTILNETDNSTLLTEICAGNATVVYNITNITNITVVECNATSATLYANSSGTFNNATITCLTNSSSSPVGEKCTNTTIYVNQTVNQTVFVNNETFCKENVNINPMAYQQVFFSSKCNITIVAPANQTTCPACPTCQACTACLPYQYNAPCAVCETCPQARECAAPRVCAEDNQTAKLLLASLQNQSVEDMMKINNLTVQLKAKQELLDGAKSIPTTVNAAVTTATEPVNTGVEAMLAAVFVVGCFSIYKARERRTPQLPKILTEDRIKSLAEKMNKPTEGAQ